MEARCWLQIVSGKPAAKFCNGYALVTQILDERDNSSHDCQADQYGDSLFVVPGKKADDVISIDESEIGSN
jgi:hypothetical protein